MWVQEIDTSAALVKTPGKSPGLREGITLDPPPRPPLVQRRPLQGKKRQNTA